MGERFGFVVVLVATILSEHLCSAEDPSPPCTQVLWYQDRDHDAFGDPAVSRVGCEQPVDYVLREGDCNDDPQARGSIFFPGAKEPCNFEDFNCDGTVRTCESAPNGVTLPRQTDAFIVTSFASGHAFRASPGGKQDLNDISDVFPDIGAKQSAYIQTDSAGSAKTLKGTGLGPFDFSSMWLKVWLKINNLKNAKDISLYVGNQNLKSYVRFNLRSTQGQSWVTEGDWVAFTMSWNPSNFVAMKLEPGVTLEVLRRSITDFQLRIVDDKTAPVTLHINRISAVAESREPYPRGVLTFAFDDGWVTQYTVARAKLAQYGFTATAYVIVGFLDTPNYMTTEQLQDLYHSGRWEIGVHAFDPVMHLQAYTNFPFDLVERDILAARQWLWERGFGYGDDGKHGLAHFAYPKGEFRQSNTTDVLQIVQRYFSSARAINERHRETVPPSDPHKLRVLYVTAPETVATVIQEIERGMNAGEWIVVVLHHLVDVPISNDQWEVVKFEALVDYLGTQLPQLPVRTVGDVLSQIRN